MRKFICETCGSASLDLCICHEDKPERQHMSTRQHISARLDAGLVAAIKERAEAERCTKTDLLERLLFEAMSDKGESK